MEGVDMQLQATDPTEDHNTEPIRTLFLSGFPHDIKQREIHNLFRFIDGYEDAILKPNGVAFVLFTDQDKAYNAMETLNGIYFDPDSAEMLRVELAKQNSKRRRDAEESQNPLFFSPERQERRLRKASQMAATSYVTQLAHPTLFGYQHYGGNVFSPYGAPDPFAFSAPPQQHHRPPKNSRQVITPCSTIFVSNLSTEVQEEELRRVFSRLDGFVRLQMFQKKDNMSCFVQFKDIMCSTNAINLLQGYVLSSSSKGPLHAEFARNEMVVKTDGSGNGAMSTHAMPTGGRGH